MSLINYGMEILVGSTLVAGGIIILGCSMWIAGKVGVPIIKLIAEIKKVKT